MPISCMIREKVNTFKEVPKNTVDQKSYDGEST